MEGLTADAGVWAEVGLNGGPSLSNSNAASRLSSSSCTSSLLEYA